MGDLWSAALGAFFGILTGLALEWWKASRHDLSHLCDEFCATIDGAAQVAAQYWLSDDRDPASKLLEARLYGYQRQLSAYSAIVSRRLHDDAYLQIEDALGLFFNALTGGEFSVVGRTSDMLAARAAQDRAGDAIIAIREAAFEKTSFSESAWRIASKLPPVRAARKSLRRW